MMLSIIIPVRNEVTELPRLLGHLADITGESTQIIVADGGSTDDTLGSIIDPRVLVVSSAAGRARQMNAGADVATGDMLLFLHADTRLPPNAHRLVEDAAASGCDWGRFDVTIDGASLLLPLIASAMNLRSRLSGIATGDQAMFVKRQTFEAVGGFPDLALMEDIALSRALRSIGPPACLRTRVTTSGRRWDQYGAIRTTWLMWRLRYAYWRGADPDRLAGLYR